MWYFLSGSQYFQLEFSSLIITVYSVLSLSMFIINVTPTIGGIFGLYDGTIDEEVLRNPHCNKIKHLNDALPNNSW